MTAAYAELVNCNWQMSARVGNLGPLQPGDKDKDGNVVGYKLNITETTRKPLLVKSEIKIRLKF